MPYTLNGEYYTMKEVSRLLGLNYGGLSRVVRSRPEIVKIGPVTLVPEWLINELMATYGRTAKSYSAVAEALGTTEQEVRDIVAAGFPSCLNSRGEEAISLDDMPFLQVVYPRVQSKNIKKSERAAAIAKLALQLKESAEASCE